MSAPDPHADGSTVLYAIGDVHGESQRLTQLHSLIFERHALLYGELPMRLIHLGDYVDRGKDSKGVIDTLIALDHRTDIDSVCLFGNHEAMMLAGLTHATPTAYETWLVNGGQQTLESYHAKGQQSVPEAHIKWLDSLPSIHVEAPRKLIFVHAGIDPNDYPNEREETYLWTRTSRFFDVATWNNAALDGWTVVHGHTPTDDFYPDDQAAAARRINIDTGAVFGGRLTAAIFAPGEDVGFIYA